MQPQNMSSYNRDLTDLVTQDSSSSVKAESLSWIYSVVYYSRAFTAKEASD